MTKRARTILFFLVTILFIIAAPSAIFYIQGYRIDFEQRRIVQTGGLAIKAWPKQAQVYIDGKLKRKTDFLFGQAFIDNLVPRKYTVRVEKEGYVSWQKDLEITEKALTDAQNIILIPEDFDWQSVPFSEEKIKNIWPSPTPSGEKTTSDNALGTLNIRPVSSAVSDVPEGTLWLSQEGYLYLSNSSGTIVNVLNVKPISVQTERQYRILAVNSQKLFLEEGSTLFWFNPATRLMEKVAEDAGDLIFSPDNKKTAYSASHEVWILYLENVETQPRKQAGERSFITRVAPTIDQISWMRNKHLVFSAGNKITVAEIDDRDGININGIPLPTGKNQNIANLSFDESDKRLYMLAGDELFVSRQLLP